MNPTTHAILNSVAASDPNLTVGERTLLQRLVTGQADLPPAAQSAGPLLLTQQQAARLLGISRVTLWRMTKGGIIRPVELSPGNPRYRRDDLEVIAREGHTGLRKTRARKLATV